MGSMEVVKPPTGCTATESSDSEDDKSMVKRTTKVVRASVLQRNGKLAEDPIASNRTKLNCSTLSPLKSATICTATSITQSQGCSSTVLTSTETSSISHNETITIKQEQPDVLDERVPPLPTNTGYFDMDPYNSQQYMDDISSPLECKPFDFLGFDPVQVQQADQNRYLTPETAAQYQQYDTGDTNNRTKTNTNNHTPSQTINVSGIKRSSSSENLSGSHKRRFYDNTQTNDQNNVSGGGSGTAKSNNGHDEKVPLSIQTCIQNFTDPGLGIFLTNIIKRYNYIQTI